MASCRRARAKPYDAREVIARVGRRLRLRGFKQLYGTTRRSSQGFAHIGGFPVGILANNGILFSESALKGTHFIELCAASTYPAFPAEHHRLHGRQEGGGGRSIAARSAKMVTAVASARVPTFTGDHRGSYGAGNYAMCGRAYSPRFLFQWPNARMSVMAASRPRPYLPRSGEMPSSRRGSPGPKREETGFKQPIRDQYERQGHPYYASARLWDDGVIDPLDTRRVLTLCLAASRNAPIEDTRFGLFRM